MKENRNTALWAVICLVVFTLSCTPQQQTASDTRPADEAAIRAADNAWSKVAENKQLDEMMAYYGEGAETLPPNAPLVNGKEAIRKMWSDMFPLPGFSVKWQPTKVEVARSGDIAYSQGTGGNLPDIAKVTDTQSINYTRTASASPGVAENFWEQVWTGRASLTLLAVQ